MLLRIATAPRDGILVSNLELAPMLYIGKRSFIPVSTQCGIHLQVDPIGAAHPRQVWRIDAAFVPGDEDGLKEHLEWAPAAGWDRGG